MSLSLPAGDQRVLQSEVMSLYSASVLGEVSLDFEKLPASDTLDASFFFINPCFHIALYRVRKFRNGSSIFSRITFRAMPGNSLKTPIALATAIALILFSRPESDMRPNGTGLGSALASAVFIRTPRSIAIEVPMIDVVPAVVPGRQSATLVPRQTSRSPRSHPPPPPARRLASADSRPALISPSLPLRTAA